MLLLKIIKQMVYIYHEHKYTENFMSECSLISSSRRVCHRKNRLSCTCVVVLCVHTCRGYPDPGYFREPLWKSMGTPEISRVPCEFHLEGVCVVCVRVCGGVIFWVSSGFIRPIYAYPPGFIRCHDRSCVWWVCVVRVCGGCVWCVCVVG